MLSLSDQTKNLCIVIVHNFLVADNDLLHGNTVKALKRSQVELVLVLHLEMCWAVRCSVAALRVGLLL